MGRADSGSLAPLQPNHTESDRLLGSVKSGRLSKFGFSVEIYAGEGGF